MTAPCKGCKDRCVEPNCHMTCQKYLDFVKCANKIRQKEVEVKRAYMPKNSTLKKYKGVMS